MIKDRKMLGMSPMLHERMTEMSKRHGLPMTVILEHLLDNEDKVDWNEAHKSYQGTRDTWPNMRRRVADYQKRFPEADDKQLSELTGNSLAQIEIITYTAHKRCIAELRKGDILPQELAKRTNVSERFAKRMWEQHNGVKSIPPQEKALW